MRIIFFGTPEMAAHTLDALISHNVDIAAIVTKPDTPQGRSSKLIAPPVKVLAQKSIPNVPILQPEKCSSAEMIEKLKSFNADLYVVVAYGEILSQNLLDSCKNGAINVHFSLLPKYRGAAPFQRAIMNGETQTGVSVIRLVKKMDAGDVLESASFTISPTMTSGTLAEALCSLGITCLLKVLDDFTHGTVKATAQDHTLATYADKITPEECHLDWTRPALELNNLIRALAPFPGAWCEIVLRGEKKRLKVYEAQVVNDLSKDDLKDDLVVACGQGNLRLLTIQLEGKPKMQVSDFLRGVSSSQIIF